MIVDIGEVQIIREYQEGDYRCIGLRIGGTCGNFISRDIIEQLYKVLVKADMKGTDKKN